MEENSSKFKDGSEKHKRKIAVAGCLTLPATSL
jgi:hypothetical protein